MTLIKLTINGKEIEVPEGVTIIQAAMMHGVEIPHFCFHKKLKISGNCRMCLVEIEKQSKLAASCAMPVTEGMIVSTNSQKVQKAREGVLEFLLINHPLDCPICDQAGECDLQDLSVNYGSNHGRFREYKRSVPPKHMGPIIKTFMNRCIHCTRCIRFCEDIVGMPELGTLHRGENTEISTFLNQAIKSELSGNLVDICPVGALTSRPYSYQGRPWELNHVNSIDITDAMGAQIRIDSYANQIKRILPRSCDSINEDWLTDKARFAFEALDYQRLVKPLVRKGNQFDEIEWGKAIKIASQHLSKGDPQKKAAVAGDVVDVEGLFALKQLWKALKSPHIDGRQNASMVSYEHRSHYLWNASIEALDDTDAILIVGDSLRFDAPLLHARIQKAYFENNAKIFHVGSAEQKNMPYLFPFAHLGSTTDTLRDLLMQKSAVAKAIGDAQAPFLILCEDVLCCEDSFYIQELCQELAVKLRFVREAKDSSYWNGYNALTSVASRVAVLDLGIVPDRGGYDVIQMQEAVTSGAIDTLLLVGADELDLTPHKNCFVIYIGHHGDRGAQVADLILPCAAWGEKESLYINCEGRVQKAHKAVNPPYDLPSEWYILFEILQGIKTVDVPKNSEDLRMRIYASYPHYKNELVLPLTEFQPLKFATKHENIDLSSLGGGDNESYYFTSVFSRNSKTMRACYRSVVGVQAKEEL